MYARSERPLTEVEREQIAGRLRLCRERLSDEAFKVVALVFVDGIAIFAGIMAVAGQDRSGPAGVVAGVVALAIANLILLFNCAWLIGDLRERRQLRDAVADGTAVVELAEGRVAVCLTDGRRCWYLLDVGKARLIAVAFFPMPPGAKGGNSEEEWAFPACLEVVTTRAHRLHLGTAGRGLASLPLPPPVSLASIAPDRRRRRQLAERLDRCPLFRGDLANPSCDLVGLLEEAPPENSPIAPPRWALLQAAVEERFGIAFGPGGLAADLLRVAEHGPPTVSDFSAAVRERLPPEAAFAPRSSRAAFFRLRTALVGEFAADRRCVRPAARLEDLVPRMRRDLCWERLARRLGQPLPPLGGGEFPTPAGVVAGVGMVLVYVVGVPLVQQIDAWALGRGVAASWWFLAAGACLVPTGFIGGMVLSMFLGAILYRSRFAWTFPADCTTVADLARFLAANGPPQAEAVPWTDRDVRQAARALLAGAVGKRPFEVRPEMRLVEDLGLPIPGVQGEAR